MNERLTAPKAAIALGVTVNTVKEWGSRLGLGARNSAGAWVYSPDDMHLLRVVQSLRQQGSGLDTITRHLQQTTDSRKGDDQQTAETPAAGAQQPGLDAEQIVSAVTMAIQGQTDLAEKYAKATHLIGRLEERVENLQTQLVEERRLRAAAEEQIKLLTAPPEPKPEALPWWKRWLQ